MNWAFSQNIPAASSKFVLVALANYANEDREAYPSISALCDTTCLDRKTVIACLDKLCALHLIRDTGKRKGFTSQVKVYFLNSPKTGTVPKTEANSSVFPTKESRFSVKESQKRDTEPSGTINEPKGNRPPKFVSELSAQIKAASEEIGKLRELGSDGDGNWHDEGKRKECVELCRRRKQWKRELLES